MDCNVQFSNRHVGWFVGGHLGMMGTCVRDGVEKQSVPQRNREGFLLCRSSVHPQPPLRWITITAPGVGHSDEVVLCALEWWQSRRLSASLLGWGAIDDAGIKRLLGVVNGRCGIANSLIEEVSQVWVIDDLKRDPNAYAKLKTNNTQGKRKGACEIWYTLKYI